MWSRIQESMPDSFAGTVAVTILGIAVSAWGVGFVLTGATTVDLSLHGHGVGAYSAGLLACLFCVGGSLLAESGVNALLDDAEGLPKGVSMLAKVALAPIALALYFVLLAGAVGSALMFIAVCITQAESLLH